MVLTSNEVGNRTQQQIKEEIASRGVVGFDEEIADHHQDFDDDEDQSCGASARSKSAKSVKSAKSEGEQSVDSEGKGRQRATSRSQNRHSNTADFPNLHL